jgi:hypothetical protein
MKKIALLLLISLTDCFTVYTKDEKVLESQNLETKEVKEERDVYILTQNLTKDGLYLLLDGYRVKEENSITLIKEKYLENKDFKWKDNIGGSPGGSLEVAAVVLVIASTVMVAELATMPLRLMTEPQERIRKEIQTNNSTKIKAISTKNISFALLDRSPSKEYIFKNDKIFIPMKDLELDYFTFKSFPYKVVSADKKVTLLKGEFNFFKEHDKNKEITSIVHENNRTKKSAICRFKYPPMRTQGQQYDEIYRSSEESCKKEYPYWATDFKGNEKYLACVEEIKDCYDATRLSE